MSLWILLSIPLAASTTEIYVLNNGGSTVNVIDAATQDRANDTAHLDAPWIGLLSLGGLHPSGKLAGPAVEVAYQSETGSHVKFVHLYLRRTSGMLRYRERVRRTKQLEEATKLGFGTNSSVL